MIYAIKYRDTDELFAPQAAERGRLILILHAVFQSQKFLQSCGMRRDLGRPPGSCRSKGRCTLFPSFISHLSLLQTS